MDVPMYISTTSTSQLTSGLSATITPSGATATVLVSISIPYSVFIGYSHPNGVGWSAYAILHSYASDDYDYNAIPVGMAFINDRRSMPSLVGTEDITAGGVLSAQFIVNIAVPTNFYISMTAQKNSGSGSLSLSFGAIGDYYDYSSSSNIADRAIMTLTEVGP
jgi:hypothetical protein